MGRVGTTHKDLFASPEVMSVEAMVQAMIDELTTALGDAAKHDKGNSAAGTRVRKAMQACKSAATVFCYINDPGSSAVPTVQTRLLRVTLSH